MRFDFIFVSLLTAISICAQFLSVATLGKVDPSLVSILSLVEIFYAIIPAFVIIGGDVGFQYIYNRFKNKRVVFLLVLTSCVTLAIACLIVIYILSFGNAQTLYLFTSVLIIVSAYVSFLASFFLKVEIKISLSSFVERFPVILNGISIVLLLFTVNEGHIEWIRNYVLWLLCFNSIIIFVLSTFLLVSKTKFIDYSKVFFRSNFRNNYKLRKIVFSNKSLYFFAIGILVFSFERLDQIFLLSVAGASLLGIYFACYKLSFIARLMVGILQSVFAPRISKVLNRDNDIQQGVYLFNTLQLITLVFSLLFLVPTLFFSSEILEFIYDQNYSKYSLVLEVITLSMFISSFNQVTFGYLNADGQSKVSFLNSLVTTSVQFLVIFVLFGNLELFAVALARLVAVAVGFSIGSSYLLSRVKNYRIVSGVGTVKIVVFLQILLVCLFSVFVFGKNLG